MLDFVHHTPPVGSFGSPRLVESSSWRPQNLGFTGSVYPPKPSKPSGDPTASLHAFYKTHVFCHMFIFAPPIIKRPFVGRLAEEAGGVRGVAWIGRVPRCSLISLCPWPPP